MKKRVLPLLIASVMLFACVGCGNASPATGLVPSTGLTPSGTQDSTGPLIKIDQISYSVSEGIEYGKRTMVMKFANNSPYDISYLQVNFVAKSNISEAQKEKFYEDIKTDFEMSDEDFEELKKREISMNAATADPIKSGATVEQIPLHYFSGYTYMRNPEHYALVEPDMITMRFETDGKTCMEYYDCKSGKYTSSSY